MAKIVSIANALTFRISPEGIKPEIRRRFVVRDDISLSDLHETIQTVMGWTNSHLHSFLIKKTEYTDEETVEELDRGKVADSVSVRSLKLKKLSREHMHAVWQLAKNNQLDDMPDEDRLLAQIMLGHEDEFSNDFEFADVLAGRDYDPESEVNPFLHITLHAVVENQLKEKELIEVYQFYNSMRKQKVSHHDTVHLILGMIAPLLLSL